MDMTKFENQAWEAIKDLNRSWTSGATENELSKFFHPNVIALISGNKKIIKGAKPCANHWRGCFERKPELLWEDFDPEVRVYEEGAEKFAIVACKFKISWLESGERKAALGNDIFTLRLEGDKWQIISATV